MKKILLGLSGVVFLLLFAATVSTFGTYAQISPPPPAGGGGLSGQTTGYLPKATSATGSTTSSHIDDGVTAANTVTISETTTISQGTSSAFAANFNSTANAAFVQGFSALCSGLTTGQECTTDLSGVAHASTNNAARLEFHYTGAGSSANYAAFDFFGGNVFLKGFPTGEADVGFINVAAARKGTFVCTAGGTITISNTNEKITSDVPISLNTAGGTITTPPAMKTVTAGTGFTVLCGASDTSTYNYDILN